MGDIIDWKEEKQAFKAMAHVPIIVENVMALVNGKSKFKEYKGSYEMISLTNGRVRGFYFSLPNICIKKNLTRVKEPHIWVCSGE